MEGSHLLLLCILSGGITAAGFFQLLQNYNSQHAGTAVGCPGMLGVVVLQQLEVRRLETTALDNKLITRCPPTKPLLISCHLEKPDNISCVQCVGEKNCHGSAKKCPSGVEDCISVYEETKIGGKIKTSIFIRLCGNCSDYKTAAIRFGKGVLRTSATCCKGNNCTPADPIIPPPKPTSRNVKAKGITCKSCFALNAKNCDCNNVFVDCTVEETRCVSRSISATGRQGYNHVAAIRGCTTEDMCVPAERALRVNKTNLKFISVCTNESDSVRNCLLPLVLTAAMFFMSTTPT